VPHTSTDIFKIITNFQITWFFNVANEPGYAKEPGAQSSRV